MPPNYAKAIIPAVIVCGLGMALYAGIAQSESAFIVLVAFLPVAWLLVFILAVKSPGERRSAQSLLRRFKYQVDLAKQQLRSDPKTIDQDVLKAFDKLHDGMKSLQLKRAIRLTRLRQEILLFPFRKAPQQGTRWQPSTLSELGYVIGIAEQFSPDAPLLALYKFSGEGRNKDGSVTDTFTIMAESVPRAHAALFAAKIHAPVTNATAPVNPPLAVPEPAGMLPRTDPVQDAAPDEDNSVGYALSLLGPITLTSVRGLVRNLHAIARLPANTTTPAGLPAIMPAAALRRNLREVLTEKLEHSEAPLRLAAQALRQNPQLLVCAIADAGRDFKDSPAELLPALAMLAEILTPANAAVRPALVSLMTEWVVLIQALRVIPAGQPIANPGLVYIEARGAETDAGFLEQIAYCLVPAAQQPAVTGANVIVTTHLTADAFRAQLRACSDMMPGKHAQAVIDVLVMALNIRKLALNTVEGFQPVKVRERLSASGNKLPRWLLLSAYPELVDLTGSPPPVQHVLWTLSGRALDAGNIDFTTLYGDRWQALVPQAWPVSAIA